MKYEYNDELYMVEYEKMVPGTSNQPLIGYDGRGAPQLAYLL